LPNRLRALAGSRERLDQTVLSLAVQSVSRCPALGSLDRTRQVASRPLRVHEAARCLTKRSPVEGAPTVDPTLPRREIDEMHTV